PLHHSSFVTFTCHTVSLSASASEHVYALLLARHDGMLNRGRMRRHVLIVFPGGSKTLREELMNI
ncbi:hypothetical protein GOODEAATRI_024119, partial [Goodea atripinnis]